MFLLLAFAATQVANESTSATGIQTPNTSNLLYISLAFGFSLGINVWAFFRISGGLFNPAVRPHITLKLSLSYTNEINSRLLSDSSSSEP
jgi:aquaporin related protein